MLYACSIWFCCVLSLYNFQLFQSEYCQWIIIIQEFQSDSGIPIGTPFRKSAGFVYVFFLTTYRGPRQPDIRPRGETKKPRRQDPMRPLPLCNAWSLRAYSVIDIRIRNWHVCETFRMIWRPGNDRGFSFLIICIFGRCINGSFNNYVDKKRGKG